MRQPIPVKPCQVFRRRRRRRRRAVAIAVWGTWRSVAGMVWLISASRQQQIRLGIPSFVETFAKAGEEWCVVSRRRVRARQPGRGNILIKLQRCRLRPCCYPERIVRRCWCGGCCPARICVVSRRGILIPFGRRARSRRRIRALVWALVRIARRRLVLVLGGGGVPKP